MALEIDTHHVLTENLVSCSNKAKLFFTLTDGISSTVGLG